MEKRESGNSENKEISQEKKLKKYGY